MEFLVYILVKRKRNQCTQKDIAIENVWKDIEIAGLRMEMYSPKLTERGVGGRKEWELTFPFCLASQKS